MSERRAPAPRALLAVPAAVAMVVGTDAGLTLLGVWAPVPSGRLGEAHGLLMVLGFVGTLVALERAVALGSPWGYAAPALLGSGGLALLVPGAERLGHLLLVAGAAGLCALYVPLWRRQRDDAVLVTALGAVLALGGAVLLVAADLGARGVITFVDLPIGMLTALVGGPFFFWLLRRTRQQAGGWA